MPTYYTRDIEMGKKHVKLRNADTHSYCKELAASISKAERDVAVNRLAVYRKWFSERVLKESTHDTVVIIPIENISPRYRDKPLGWVYTIESLHFHC